MRTKQVLTIMMVVGLALGYKASAAGEFYERESTNEWFTVIAKDADLSDTTHWQKPTNEDSSATVKGDVIKLETGLDDPLKYTTESSTAAVMVVNARFTATVNLATPELTGEAPQAAITVVANDDDAVNWWGFVGDDGGKWVKFVNEIPTVGQEYDVSVEFDFREGKEKIRYSVGGTVLKAGDDDDGWYDNPKASSESISSVEFAGAGDIGDFAGSSIVFRPPPIEMGEASQAGDGYDYTNGTLNVAATVRENGSATLKVFDFATGFVKEFTIETPAGTTQVGWDVSTVIAESLVPGATYDYEVSITAAGETVTKTGTFVSASTDLDKWFHADATGDEEDVEGGEWENSSAMKKPQIQNHAYTIVEDAKFNVTDHSKGANDLVVVDANVVFDEMVDGNSLTSDAGARGGLVAATKDGSVWMALTTVENETRWVQLAGAPAPEVSVQYVVRAEISFLAGHKQIRYSVKKATDEDFAVLTLDDVQWLAMADDGGDALTAVEFEYSSKLAKLEASITDRALATVNGKKYCSMAEAMAAGGDITLLTNVTVSPTETGTWKFTNKGTYNVIVDLSGLPGAAYSWKADGTLTVAFVKGATYLIW